VEIKNFTLDNQTALAYQFKITQEKNIPLLKRPMPAVFDLKDENNYKYKRMYYYHEQGNIWLALSARLDKGRNLLLSDKIDFAQGIIGLFVDNKPLRDRIEAKTKPFPLILNDPSPNLKPDPFTITLGDDIISKGYTINQQGVRLAVLPGVLNIASKVKLNFQNGVLDYNFEPLNKTQSVLKANQKLFIELPVEEKTYNDKTIVFWDNNQQDWREMPSFYSYKNQTVRAKSAFHFGKYKVINKPGIFIGKASWFRDSLISKTRWAAASNDYPLGTKARIINLENNKSVEVKLLSTGPFVAGRIIDLTRSAFAEIANPGQGVIKVRVEAI
jgi:hypothetical protein